MLSFKSRKKESHFVRRATGAAPPRGRGNWNPSLSRGNYARSPRQVVISGYIENYLIAICLISSLFVFRLSWIRHKKHYFTCVHHIICWLCSKSLYNSFFTDVNL